MGQRQWDDMDDRGLPRGEGISQATPSFDTGSGWTMLSATHAAVRDAR